MYCPIKSNCIYLLVIFFIPVRISWIIEVNRNLVFKLKSILGLYYVVLLTPNASHEKVTKTEFEMKQLPDFQKTDSNEETSGLKWTKKAIKTNKKAHEKYV